jgi:DNA-binding MarR family transcriptional regulator
MLPVLEKDDLIERSRDEKDQRAYRMYLGGHRTAEANSYQNRRESRFSQAWHGQLVEYFKPRTK